MSAPTSYPAEQRKDEIRSLWAEYQGRQPDEYPYEGNFTMLEEDFWLFIAALDANPLGREEPQKNLAASESPPPTE